MYSGKQTTFCSTHKNEFNQSTSRMKDLKMDENAYLFEIYFLIIFYIFLAQSIKVA